MGDTIDFRDIFSYEKIQMLCFYCFSSYLHSYIDIPNETSVFLSFLEKNNLINSKEKSFFRDREACFTIRQNDSTATLLYGDSLFVIMLPKPAFCSSIEGYYNRHLVKIFDTSYNLCYSNILYRKFHKMLYGIHHSFFKQGYIAVSDSLSENSSTIPVIVWYQYDRDNGLTIHKSCSGCHTMIESGYSDMMLMSLEQFCQRFHCSKIIYADYMFYRPNTIQ